MKIFGNIKNVITNLNLKNINILKLSKKMAQNKLKCKMRNVNND